MRNAQASLFSPTAKSTAHGGVTRTGRRKTARPISTKHPLHLVLRSSRARGEWSFLHRQNRHRVQEIVRTTALRFGVRVLGFQNVGNHLHLLVQGKSRPLLQSFFRVLPQALMFAVTGARRGKPQGRFFDHTFFSRVVQWGRDLDRTKGYLWKNELEAAGVPKSLIPSLRKFFEPPRGEGMDGTGSLKRQ